MKWPEVPLPKIALINPSRPRNLEIVDNQLMTFVPMPAVSEQTASIEYPEERSYADVKKGFTYFEENDVLFAKTTPCMENGKSAIASDLIGGVGFGSTEFHVIRSNQSLVLAKYIHYFIRQHSFRDTAKARMRGAVGQQRVPKDFLDDTVLPLPSISEQNRIVEILDQADRLRKLRADADAKAQRILPALFFKIFGDPATNPMGWDSEFIGDIAYVKGGKRLPKGEIYSPEPTNFRYIRGTDIYPNFIDNRNLKYLYSYIQQKIKRYIVQQGDVVITIAGKIGVAAPVGDELKGVNLTENAAKLSPKFQDKYDSVFLSVFLNSPYAQSQIQNFTGKVTIGKLALFRIEKIKILLPPLSLQQRFSGQFASISNIFSKYQIGVFTVEVLFQTLLYRAFTGELTASWREAHMKELLQEMDLQAKALAS